MPFHPSSQHARNAFRIDVLSPVCADESESLVKMSVGIRDAGDVFQFVWNKKFVRFGFIVGEMHESESHALEFNIVADFGQLGDRLAAKRSTKVAQKDQQQRAGFHQRGEALTGLRLVLVQQRCINALLRHFKVALLPPVRVAVDLSTRTISSSDVVADLQVGPH